MRNKETPAATLPQSKPHYPVLDGLRGIAALSVVLFHFMEWVFPSFPENFIGHGFLAVDFFFCLSGFVIAYAYDNRVGEMGVLRFFKVRLIRLHPLVLLGSVLGLAAFLLDPLEPGTITYTTGGILLLFLCSAFLIPYPVMEDRAFNLFGLNAPSWSLFWEYVANIAYAMVLYRLGRRSLFILTLLAAAGICLVAYRAGNLAGGWSGSNFWDGGVRVAYSFLAGMLVYRSGWIIENKLGFAGLTLLLLLAFLMPFFTWNWLAESAVVLFYFPLLVSLGAGAALAPSLEKLCAFPGKISYPLYMTHYWAIWIFGHYFTRYKPGTGQLAFVIIAGTVFLLVVACGGMRLFDVPVRNYLTRRLQAREERRSNRPPLS